MSGIRTARRGSIASARQQNLVTFDAVGANNNVLGGFSPSANISGTYACSGANRAVFIPIAGINNGLDASGQSRVATYDSVTMTSLGMVQDAAGSASFVELFGLLNPPTGSKTWAVTVQNGGNTGRALIGAPISYNGVASFGAVYTNFGSSSAMTVVATSAVNEMVVQAFEAQAAISSYDKTSRLAGTVAGHSTAIQAGDAVGTASISFGAIVASGNWAGIAARLVPA